MKKRLARRRLGFQCMAAGSGQLSDRAHVPSSGRVYMPSVPDQRSES